MTANARLVLGSRFPLFVICLVFFVGVVNIDEYLMRKFHEYLMRKFHEYLMINSHEYLMINSHEY